MDEDAGSVDSGSIKDLFSLFKSVFHQELKLHWLLLFTCKETGSEAAGSEAATTERRNVLRQSLTHVPVDSESTAGPPRTSVELGLDFLRSLSSTCRSVHNVPESTRAFRDRNIACWKRLEHDLSLNPVENLLLRSHLSSSRLSAGESPENKESGGESESEDQEVDQEDLTSEDQEDLQWSVSEQRVEKEDLIPEDQEVEKEDLIPEDQEVEKEDLTPEDQEVEKEDLTPEDQEVEKEDLIPEDQEVEKEDLTPEDQEVEKEDLTPEDQEVEKEDLTPEDQEVEKEDQYKRFIRPEIKLKQTVDVSLCV
ncbi:unnamed protein product [Pleuronectes platessa]|uniref:Uncharacterized protein n=1 Tax=Pleuronectes platessa TaxID=8262 RepID=A0A9N7TVR5_PLEPL|nr:unnamed protein product [Pleuronectes platessa]